MRRRNGNAGRPAKDQMRILILLGHPNPGSFNHALAQAVRDDLRAHGHDVVFHDLCAERFDPLLGAEEIPQAGQIPPSIQKHCDELGSADGIVVVEFVDAPVDADVVHDAAEHSHEYSDDVTPGDDSPL